ncbi:cuticle protein 18.7-like [Toxorhynchites rutilus septentrionalis]|uniref:cuticle protein 18.7-like n=1 Tax=Toxorhynchites rutilus septentrionalis TaxID=329112 RepID=UPI002478CC42|nr:cuticle protein 18.7-like [Toxorhynchites rutilus septentrionalis]
MRAFVLGSVLLLASACSGADLGHSTQYHKQDVGGFSFGYSHPVEDHHSHHEPATIGHDGAPLETHEVKAAKAAHFAAHAEAKSRLHKRHVPVDTPEVAAAKAAHLAAHAAVAPHGHDAGEKWHGPLHHPVIEKGVPVDTPAVKHAKAVHAEAHAVAEKHDSHGDEHEQKWYGPKHIPVIKDGVPVETPEVQHAKAAHLDAVASAKKY